MARIHSPLYDQRIAIIKRIFIFLLILLVLLTTAFAALKFSNINITIAGITIGSDGIHAASTGIGVTTAPDGEHIGISNGTYAFDTGSGRIDGDLKIQAAAALKKGDITTAEALWQQAVLKDTNDAEALIYQEDQSVLASKMPYITIVVATMLSGNASNLSAGRDNLQGAYVAQKEYNDGAKLGNVQVYLLIANAGSNSDFAISVANQIVQAAQQDHHIIGVMGWPYSSYVAKSYSVLANAHLPMVSPTASSDTLSGISPYFFRVAPSNNAQAIAGAHYAESPQLGATRAALFVDPSDPYSQSLATDFKRQFTADSHQVVATENYTEEKTSNLASLLQNALNANPAPNLIYFSGYASDMSVLLTDLPASANVELMGGDGLYQLGGYASSSRAGFERLHFTAFAYPDEWDYFGKKNNFFTSYSNDFDHAEAQPGGTYGYNRADSDAILSYDATITLLQGCANVLGNQTTTTPDALRRGLSMITGTHALQGVSGQISFGTNNEPQNKAVVILAVDPVGHIHMITTSGLVQGCFLLIQCE